MCLGTKGRILPIQERLRGHLRVKDLKVEVAISSVYIVEVNKKIEKSRDIKLSQKFTLLIIKIIFPIRSKLSFMGECFFVYNLYGLFNFCSFPV